MSKRSPQSGKGSQRWAARSLLVWYLASFSCGFFNLEKFRSKSIRSLINVLGNLLLKKPQAWIPKASVAWIPKASVALSMSEFTCNCGSQFLLVSPCVLCLSANWELTFQWIAKPRNEIWRLKVLRPWVQPSSHKVWMDKCLWWNLYSGEAIHSGIESCLLTVSPCSHFTISFLSFGLPGITLS